MNFFMKSFHKKFNFFKKSFQEDIFRRGLADSNCKLIKVHS